MIDDDIRGVCVEAMRDRLDVYNIRDEEYAGVVDSISSVIYKRCASKYVDTYERLVVNISSLEDKIRDLSSSLQRKSKEIKIIKDYHVILLKKYRLLVSEREFVHYINSYDKNIKLDLSVDVNINKYDDRTSMNNIKNKLDHLENNLQNTKNNKHNNSSHFHTIDLDDSRKYPDSKKMDVQSIDNKFSINGSEISNINVPVQTNRDHKQTSNRYDNEDIKDTLYHMNNSKESNNNPRNKPSHIHNIDYLKFGQSKIGGIMQQKYKQ